MFDEDEEDDDRGYGPVTNRKEEERDPFTNEIVRRPQFGVKIVTQSGIVEAATTDPEAMKRRAEKARKAKEEKAKAEKSTIPAKKKKSSAKTKK